MQLRIRDLREDHDLTQKQIAAYLMCDQSLYSKYARMERELPLHQSSLSGRQAQRTAAVSRNIITLLFQRNRFVFGQDGFLFARDFNFYLQHVFKYGILKPYFTERKKSTCTISWKSCPRGQWIP